MGPAVAWADGGFIPWSGATCPNPTQCTIGAGSLQPPGPLPVKHAQRTDEHPAGRRDDAKAPAGATSPASVVPADCFVINLQGACVGRGYQGAPPTPAAGQTGASSEAVLRQALGELQLPTPVIRMNPDTSAAQIVRVPVWLWIDRSVWRPVSKTVQVPGVSVTATATPQRVVWSMGDGGSVACAGPGTPYSSSYPADAASPDCGYSYQRSSAGQPGETFLVTATVVWTVVWQGAGKSGTVPGLATRAQVPVKVTEVQGIVVSRSGAI